MTRFLNFFKIDLIFFFFFLGEIEGHNEEDAESGNGPSIPHSPNSHSPHTVGIGNEIWNHPVK